MELLAIIGLLLFGLIIWMVNRGNQIIDHLEPEKLTMEQLRMHQIFFLKKINAAYKIKQRIYWGF